MDIAQVSLSKGEISPLAADRTDEAFYASALAKALNVFIHAEGAASNRAGSQFIGQSVSTVNGSYIIPFIYNNAQSYLCEFSITPSGGSPGSINVYLNGSLVQAGIPTPYTQADLPNLRWAQSADTLNVVVATQPMYQLKRLTPTTFSFTTPTFLFGPFQDLNVDGNTTVYSSGIQGTVTLIASAPIFKPQHVGTLFTIQEQFLGSIQPWEAQKLLAGPGGASAIGQYCRSDGKIYQCVDALTGDTTATGTFQPVHTSGTQKDGTGGLVLNVFTHSGVTWQYVSTDSGVALITGYTDSQHVTAVVQSNKGIYANFPPTVVGGPQTVVGPFTFNGTGSAVTFSPLTAVTSADPNQFYVTVGGVFQDPTTYSIAGTSITFNTPPAAGTGNVVVAQVTGTVKINAGGTLLPGLALSTYWAFGSFSVIQGYPSDVCWFNDRLVLAGTKLQPQSFWTSRTADYLNFGVSQPQVAADAITETINARQQNPINNLLAMNNLLIGTASATWRATDSSGIGSITPENVSLIPQEFFGMQPVPAVQTGTTILYVQWGGRKIRDILFQFFNDKFLGKELTVFARQIFPVGTACTRLAFAPEPYGLAYCVRSDGVMGVVTYLPEQEVIAWTRYTTAGFYEDVCVMPENGSYSVYVLVRRTIQGISVRYIERFAPREYATVSDAHFVDAGLTYDGRNTSVTTMTLSAPAWDAQSSGTLTASGLSGWSGFAASDVTLNNAIWFTDSTGVLIARVRIIFVLSATVAECQFLDIIPAALQNVSTSSWAFARTQFAGLNHLIGQSVSVFSDGSVQPQRVVDLTGTITLQNAGAVVHAGLGYVSQLEGLNPNVQNQESIRNRMKSMPRLSVVVDESYPFLAGPDFDHLVPVAQRQFESYNQPIKPHTGVISVQLPTEPLEDISVCLQMSDPAPWRVLGWLADIEVGDAP